MNTEKLPYDTVPWSTLSPGDCFVYNCPHSTQSDVFMKCQSPLDFKQFNVNLSDGEIFKYPNNPEFQVIPLVVNLQWKVKTNKYAYNG